MPRPQPPSARFAAVLALLHDVVRRTTHLGITAFFRGVAVVVVAVAVLVVAVRAPAVLGAPATLGLLLALRRGAGARTSAPGAGRTHAAPASAGVRPMAPAPSAGVTWHVAGAARVELRAPVAPPVTSWRLSRQPAPMGAAAAHATPTPLASCATASS